MKKFIWIFLSCLTIASGFITWKYWDKVFPIVNLSITMDRAAAIKQASEFANKKQFDIEHYDVVVKFKEEGMLQAFVELEGGGKQAFLDMISNNYYQPFQWVVRFYKHGKISEYFVQFTPDGKLYEFQVKIAEDEKGADLHKDKALKIALQELQDFDVDITNYCLVEHNMVTQPSNRVDHTFVYERTDVSLEKGKYRLQLKVCGDQLCCLERTVKIPDEFIRRYQQMFADNKLLANVARNLAVFIYLFIFGLFIALFFFQNTRFMLLQKHAYIGVAFWLVIFLSSLNGWPFLWNFYSTEHSPILFTLSYLAMIAFSSIMFSLFVYLLMILVDSADRYMFRNHIQFLKSWSSGAVASVQLFQMTALAYMGAVIFVGYEVIYNLWTLKMGWWSPLGRLVDPNILSSYIPFLSPIGQAFQAGFWEELAFRGLPLAGIAFLTRNSKHKKWWFLLMFVVQAIIFGALHANYPQQPSYNRLIELLIPSFIFGAMYYFFGLLPGIIMHYVYDAFLMSIPIWVSGLVVQKILAAICIAIPLLVVVVAWYRNKRKLVSASSSVYNHAMPFEYTAQKEEILVRPVGCKLERKYALLLTAMSLIAIVGSYFYLPHNFSNSAAKISGEQALAIATKVIKDYGFSLENDFKPTINLIGNSDSMPNKFIWQTYGKTVYQDLEQDYIAAHGWQVLWKNFTASVEDRAEKFGVLLSGQGKILKIVHNVPESRPGADLNEKQAQELSLDLIQKIYGLEKNKLELVSCESKKHENRRDFLVIYKDLHRYEFKPELGQARVSVKLAGDELDEISRMIHVPEQWSREENNRNLQEFILSSILYAMGIFCIVWALYFCIRRLRFSSNFLMPIFVVACCYVFIRSLNFLNAWDQILMTLSTAEPWVNQIISLASSYFVYYLMLGFLYVIALSLLIKNGARVSCKTYWPWLMGLVLMGAAIECLRLWFINISVQMVPLDYEFGYINFKQPIFGMFTAYFLDRVLLGTLDFMSFSIIAQYLSGYTRILFFIFIGILISDVATLSNIPVWIITGVLMGLVLYLLNRLIISHDLESVFLISFGSSAMKLLPTVLFMAYPGVLVQFAASSLLFGLFTLYIYKKL